jgi:D-xylose 1-dehydrogenase (NADP+, D-xylono-1,5-lactone-forming)
MRWGVISTGRIARAFLDALRPSETEQVIAVASRDPAKAAEIAREFGVAQAYGSYQALLADPDVQAVYIAVPNSLHIEWADAAAQASKQILCEKPLGVTREQSAAMFGAARQAGVWLMEAFMYRFHPRTLKIQELVASGAIGTPQLIRASFGFAVTDPANVRLSAELAGGALMDVGCYCVNFSRMIVGRAPARVSATARWGSSGVDETLAATLDYEAGAIAQISCSLASSHHHLAQVIGSEGIIEVEEAFTPPPDRPARLRVRRGARFATVEEIEFPPVNQYRLEAEGFGRLVAAGHAGHGLPEMPLVETLDNMATIEALLRSARAGHAVEVEG